MCSNCLLNGSTYMQWRPLGKIDLSFMLSFQLSYNLGDKNLLERGLLLHIRGKWLEGKLGNQYCKRVIVISVSFIFVSAVEDS